MIDFAATRPAPLHHIANRRKRLPPLRVGVGGHAHVQGLADVLAHHDQGHDHDHGHGHDHSHGHGHEKHGH